jgi:hypothetical protein
MTGGPPVLQRVFVHSLDGHFLGACSGMGKNSAYSEQFTPWDGAEHQR